MHKTCLQRWIDEKQQGNSSVEVACPQCNSTYIIVYPRSDFFVKCLDMIDRVLNKICPLVAGGVLIGSVYWTAVTYGAVTVMMVLGHKDGLNCMEKTDPLLLLLGLPSIPFFLIVGRLIRWQDALLKFWRKHSTKLFGLYLPNCKFNVTNVFVFSLYNQFNFNLSFITITTTYTKCHLSIKFRSCFIDTYNLRWSYNANNRYNNW